MLPSPSAGLMACLRGRRTPSRREASHARRGARRGSPAGAPTAPGRHLALGLAPGRFPLWRSPGGQVRAGISPKRFLPGLRGLSFNRPPYLQQAAQTRCQPAAGGGAESCTGRCGFLSTHRPSHPHGRTAVPAGGHGGRPAEGTAPPSPPGTAAAARGSPGRAARSPVPSRAEPCCGPRPRSQALPGPGAARPGPAEAGGSLA